MAVTVRKTITEHTNGRKRDPESPTGWVRRSGRKEAGKAKVGNRTMPINVDVWEPCDPPKTFNYGAPGAPTGGTVHTVIEGLTGATLPPLYAEECRTLLAGLCWTYSVGMEIFYGSKYIGGGKESLEPHEAYEEAQAARRRARELFGVDLENTNLVKAPE